jgi:signal transduction histidine kinase
MLYANLRIKSFFKRYYLVILFFQFPVYAQIPRVTQLQQQLKQPHPDTARLRLLQQLTEAYSTVDPKKKFYYANIYKALAQKLHNGQAEADSYINMGIAYGIQSKLDSALYYFSLAYTQSVKSKYPLGIGRSLADMAYAYDRLDDEKESIKYNFQALAIYKKIKYERGINQCLVNIGSIYYDLKQYHVAESYFNQALKNFTASKDEAGVGSVLYELGNCYLATRQDQKALDYLKRSFTIRKRIGDINGSSLSGRSVGIGYFHQQKYDEALFYLKNALKGLRTLDDKFEQCAAHAAMADVYLAMKQYQVAAGHAQEGLTLARSARSKIAAAEALVRLVAINKAMNRLDQAFNYQSQLVANQDSIRAEDALKSVTLTEISRIRAENVTLAKHNEAITSENTNYLARLNKYSNVIITIFVVLASVILLLFVLYRQNLKKQATNKLLIRQKQEIADINSELEGLNHDINGQMELIHKQNIELGKLNDIKSKFFSIVSHDLRSPLSTLQTLFTVYHQGAISEKEMGALLIKMEDNILVTANFLDNLLEWSKSQLEGIVINTIDFDINDCITENIRLFDPKASLKQLRVVNQTLEPVYINADKDMINLVIRNLLSNSVKFCNAGDEISFKAELKDERVILSISDTGPGISEADRDKLFNLEHTISTGSQGEKGNHLGLILCRDMVMQNKGIIWLDPELGRGTTFWLDLPAGKVVETSVSEFVQA